MQPFLPNSANYLFDREVGGLGMFSVEQCCSDPDFIGDFDAAKQVALHKSAGTLQSDVYITTKYYT